jgi:hypothetical protein
MSLRTRLEALEQTRNSSNTSVNNLTQAFSNTHFKANGYLSRCLTDHVMKTKRAAETNHYILLTTESGAIDFSASRSDGLTRSRILGACWISFVDGMTKAKRRNLCSKQESFNDYIIGI